MKEDSIQQLHESNKLRLIKYQHEISGIRRGTHTEHIQHSERDW